MNPAPPLELSLLEATLNGLGYPAAPTTGQDELIVQVAGGRELGANRPMAVRAHRADGGPVVSTMLTFSVDYAFSPPEGRRDDARLATAIATRYLILGHFEADDDGSLHLRYSMVIDSSAPPSAPLLAQVVSVLDYEQLHFGDHLEALCAGTITITDFDEIVGRGEQTGAN